MKIKGRVRGEYRIQVYKATTMELVKDTGWFPNLILDQGLNALGTQDTQGWCQVGTSSVAPSDGQTALVALVAATSSIMQTDVFNAGAPDYEGYITRRFRFGVGVAAGNLSEVGCGWGPVGDLFSRALIVDGGGTPTTITVLSDEVLDVSYKVGAYLDLTDHIFQISIGGVLRDCVLRAALCETWIDASTGNPGANGMQSGWIATVYDGTIGAITASPSGGGAGNSAAVAQAYSNNSLIRKVDFEWDLNTGNFGIESALFIHSMGFYQVSFSPPIAKDDTKVLSLTFEWSWDRH